MRGTLIAEFSGPVQCRREAGAGSLALTGRQRSDGTPLDLLFTASEPAGLPVIVSDVDVFALEPGRWRLRAHGGSWTVTARALLVHHDVSAVFLAAVPPPPLKFRIRLGWSLLLKAARIPGVVRLLQWMRSR